MLKKTTGEPTKMEEIKQEKNYLECEDKDPIETILI